MPGRCFAEVQEEEAAGGGGCRGSHTEGMFQLQNSPCIFLPTGFFPLPDSIKNRSDTLSGSACFSVLTGGRGRAEKHLGWTQKLADRRVTLSGFLNSRWSKVGEETKSNEAMCTFIE